MSRIDSTATSTLPPIVIPAGDYSRLVRLVESAGPKLAQVSDYLLRELRRAQIVDDAAADARVVRIGSLVTYREGASGRQRTIRLVWPHEADVNHNRVSVLSVIGAALLGMSPGQTIDWPSPVGGTRMLTVLAIHGGGEPPDAA
ncbi:MAG: nucleoside diphosphate kinase regulator [Gammaproteobacteria bacterium]|nr:nucleoside diphosphate kinase regulator [Gammaproteobacteria bacterium]